MKCTRTVIILFLLVNAGSPLPEPVNPENGEVTRVECSYLNQCTLPCNVQIDGPLLNPPTVEWYGVNRNTAMALSEIDCWRYTSLCDYLDYTHYNFTQPSSFECKEVEAPLHYGDSLQLVGDNAEAVYFDCAYVMESFYPGDYQCHVFVADRGGLYEVKNITSKRAKEIEPVPAGLIIEPPEPVCFMPSARNLSMKLHEKDNGGGHVANFTWISSGQNPCSPCRLPYCDGTRRYVVKILVFNSVPFDLEEPDYSTDWTKTAMRRQTFLEYDNPEAISTFRYYVFQVRNERPEYTLHWSVGGRIQIATSDVFYFGEQDQLSLLEPVNDVVYNITSSSEHVVRCVGHGIPPPSMTLAIYNSDNQRVWQRTEATKTTNTATGKDIYTIEWLHIFNGPVEFVCEARNHVVTAGKIEERVVSATIQFNIIQ